MYYLDKFVEKLNKKEGELKKKYNFTLGLRKKLFWLFVGLTIIAISIYGMYKKYYESDYIFVAIFAAFFVYGCFAMIHNIFSYKLEVDLENGKIISKKDELLLENVTKVVLKPMLIGKNKKLVLCLEFYTIDNKMVVFPIYMSKKIQFVYIFKKIFNKKFEIEKL